MSRRDPVTGRFLRMIGPRRAPRLPADDPFHHRRDPRTGRFLQTTGPRHSPRLPAEPFHAHAEHVGTAQAARDWRLDERRVRALKRQRTVQLDTADRLALGMGSHLSLLYGGA